MKKFEIGSVYQVRSICDHNCVWSYKITGRTACTVTLEDDHGEVKRCRINRKTSEYIGAEAVFPMGQYSMAPMLTADKIA